MKTIQIREVQVSYGKKRTTSEATFSSASTAVSFLRRIAPNNSQEHVIAVYLDGAHKPCGYSIVCTGLAASCPIHPREVFQRAVLIGAYSVILAHNHPSGSCAPSREDETVTKQMISAGKTVGIRVLDHIVFTDSDHYSFQAATDLFD